MTDRASDSVAFERWMHEVDSETYRLAGLSIHDLPDQPFRDLWDAGLRPAEVVEQVLEDERLEDWS